MQGLKGAKILSFGRAVPETVVRNSDLEKLFETNDDWIFSRTGIKERRVADPNKGETAVKLGSEAALKALSKTNIKAEDIDLIICATATGDYLFPATACLIQNSIGANNAVAFDLSAACTGYIYALNTAYNFIRSGQCRNVLVVAVDLMSKFVDWGDRRTAILFGDGAGATLITAVEAEENQMLSFFIRSEGDSACSLVLPNVSSRYPVKAEDIKEKLVMVEMDGQAVYQFAVKIVPESITKACEQAGISTEDIDYVVPHQANMRIIESASKRLKIHMDKFICNMDRYGNTSAASIPIAFDEAIEEAKIKLNPNKKQKIAMVGFGAGLTWGAAIIDY
jgi:3-oxoacyl-[acyl-carrier-protein] synthase-3